MIWKVFCLRSPQFRENWTEPRYKIKVSDSLEHIIQVRFNLRKNNKKHFSFSPPLAPPSEPLEFKTAAVSADYKKCSEYGADILRVQNGNAVDAAIATALCVGVVNAHSAGIGGGGFMIVYDKKSGESPTHLNAPSAV